MIAGVLVVGLLVGGLLNVGIDRLPRQIAVLQPWSRCPACAVARPWWQFLPLAGFLLARGTCASCGERYPWRQLVVEVAVPALFALVWLRFGLSWQALVVAAYLALFIAIIFIDIEHRLILNQLTYPAAIIALAISPLWPELGILKAVLGGILGFAVMFLPAILGGMGFGDVKLVGLIGLLVGFPLVFVALTIGVMAGGISAALLLIFRKKGRKDSIAYGPYLAAGGIITILYGQAIWQWYVLR